MKIFFSSYFGYELKIKASVTLEHVTNNKNMRRTHMTTF